MKKISLKAGLPYVVAILLFFVLSLLYFSPILEGKKLNQHDNYTFQGGSKEIRDYNKTHDDVALWTNSMFGGMPSYLIALPFTKTIFSPLYKLANILNHGQYNFLFWYLIGFYIALLLFGVNPWLSIVGAIAFGFSSYDIIIIAAGHNTKAMAIGFMAPIIGGLYYAFHKNRWGGSLIMALFLGLQLYANHLQITYYTLLLVIVLGITEFVGAIRTKQLVPFSKTAGILVFVTLLAVGANITRLWTTYEYGKYSIRGKSELTHDQQNRTSGLDKDYATAWSYGKAETFTLMIPNFNGGSSTGGFDTDSKTYQTLKDNNIPNARQIVKQLPGYWGPQPFTSGPVYVGAIICFLFILGLILVKGPLKWWLVVATALSVVLAWGKNFMPLTDFFLNFVPGYNKFRTVSMILVIADFTIPMLGFLALKRLLSDEVSKKEWLNAFKWAFGITAGFSLVFALVPGLAGSFTSAQDGQLPGWLLESLQEDRRAMLRSDAFRSLIFIVLFAAVLWGTFEKKVTKRNGMILMGVLILVDFWGVDRRYLNKDNFVTPRQDQQHFAETTADKEILKDKDPDFRVLNMTVSTFNDATTSYYHESIGGYHGAKMRRYQELIEYHLQHEMQTLGNRLKEMKSNNDMDSLFVGLNAMNMMNTKYVIVNPNAGPLVNQNALGDAWLVKGYRMVDNSDQEIAALNMINPADQAVIDKRFAPEVNNVQIQFDPDAQLKLTSYSPNEVDYHFKGKGNQLAVFSEIYYPKGWNVYIDGKKMPYFRTDYVLRGMVLPAGDYDIRFKFQPVSYRMGNNISLASSAILLLLLLGMGLMEFRRRKQAEA